ncbi:MAG: EAL domain-containing protein, partial [Cohaesibacter sp.]|nr:EAL domain-containing protein [Cohaesibacter sp.]
AFGALKWLTESVIFLGRASLNCLDNAMQKVRIKKENTPALSVERYLPSKPFQSILWVNLSCRWYNLSPLHLSDRLLGLRIALDDFGTGYSNLSQLSNRSFDRIKIDRSFIANFKTDHKQMQIVKGIMSLGEGLGLHTTAEGIEEMEQLSILQELGIEYGQGYHIGRPANAEQTRDFIHNHMSQNKNIA